MTEKRFTFHHDVDGIDYIQDEINGFCFICDKLLCSYLVKDDEIELGYYNSRCKKGHYECARVSLKHCKDFERKVFE